MKITILTGLGETEFGSNICLAKALKKLGHDVWTVGPNYANTYSEQATRNKEADVVLKDTPYPHFYSYREILDVSPWMPDMIFAIDPRGAVNGEKPKDILSCFYSTDSHRAGELHMRLIQVGQYDIVFVGQGAYLPFFERSAPVVHVLWPAVEASRFPDDIHDEPVCDIIFVGHSGIAKPNPIGGFRETCDFAPECRRYDGRPPSYDYAERAEFLLRLSDDFDVRIDYSVWKTPDFCKTLQKGRIGFNRSILHDCSIRNFEVMAAGRPLVTDDIYLPPTISPYWKLMGDIRCSHLYPSLYRPFYPNFNIEYAYVKRIIQEYLNNKTLRVNTGLRARQYVLQNHTWENRAEDVIATIERQKEEKKDEITKI